MIALPIRARRTTRSGRVARQNRVAGRLRPDLLQFDLASLMRRDDLHFLNEVFTEAGGLWELFAGISPFVSISDVPGPIVAITQRDPTRHPLPRRNFPRRYCTRDCPRRGHRASWFSERITSGEPMKGLVWGGRGVDMVDDQGVHGRDLLL